MTGRRIKRLLGEKVEPLAKKFARSCKTASEAPERKTHKRSRIVENAGPSKPVFRPCGDSVASLLTAHDRRHEKVRLGEDMIHVSALVKGECLRAIQLASMEKLVAHNKPKPSDRLLWAIGKAVEAHIRESLIQLYGRENTLGQWSCLCGRHEYQGVGDTSTCHTCGGIATVYSEYHLMDTSIFLSGSPDLILRPNAQGKWTPIEIKSIKVVGKGGVRNASPEFHTLERPSRDHALQVLIYRELMERLKLPVTKVTIVAYGAKDWIVESPYKFFDTDGAADENKMAVNHLIGMAEEYAKCKRSKNTIMPRLGLCSNCNTPRAKACPVAAQCFSRNK